MSSSPVVVITGGTGFLGRALVGRLSQDPAFTLRVVARRECELLKLQRDFPGLEVVAGNVADAHTWYTACRGGQVVAIYHLAAFKHVRLAEAQPLACLESNVVGTLNLVRLAPQLCPRLRSVLGVSTDKAVQVRGQYGASKLALEGLFLEAERLHPRIQWRVVRYGNVMYSTGSVLCIWRERLKKRLPVWIAQGDSTRFYWTVEEAVNLILQCLEDAPDARPWVPELRGCSLRRLLQAMVRKYAPDPDQVRLEERDLETSDNMHEKLTVEGPNSAQVRQLTDEELDGMV